MKITATQKGANAIFLFIAELQGFKNGTPTEKLRFGKASYLADELHVVDYTTEDGRKEAHENIWLQRLYDELDQFYCLAPLDRLNYTPATLHKCPINTEHVWHTPIELDASASMLQYIGILLNDERLMSMTNLVGTTLSDPWKFDGINRTQFKHAATPLLYGSSKACHELWQDKGHKYTMDQVKAFNKELSTGALGLANAFKDFLITNVKPQPTMQVRIADEVFTIECNRYRNVGEETKLYNIYDTESASIRTIHHTTTKKVPDLDQFRRYFMTLLIHNLDSQAGDSVMTKVMAKYGWGIDIHDAFIVNPEAAEDVRDWYSAELTNIHANRKTILANYFQSIGIGPEAQSKWNKVQDMVHQYTADFVCQRMALK